MLSLLPDRLAEMVIPIPTSWLLVSCIEAKAKQDLWLRQKPEVLNSLKQQAIVQSVESSNRIEGVIVPRERLQPLALEGAVPNDRSEEEIAGYSQALNWIFEQKSPFQLTSDTIKYLHYLAQSGMIGDAGEWKKRDNEIIEILPNGERVVRFVPVKAKETPEMMEILCQNYHEACAESRIPVLLIITTFVFDFLCIHPFRDGNGRVSRLVTTLLLQSHGFLVGNYISLERLIEERKIEYYHVLKRCSIEWHEGRNELIPWWNFLLSILWHAYKELESQCESNEE